MIQRYRNYRRKKRLFIDKTCEKRFISENMKNKMAGYILAVNVIKHYMAMNNDREVNTRSKHLRQDGLTPPATLVECDEMINDLKQWYL